VARAGSWKDEEAGGAGGVCVCLEQADVDTFKAMARRS
jgi:hypothetical protein